MQRPNPNDDPAIHTLRDATDKPPGVLPRRTQQYIVLGLALLIVLIALFSGHGAKPATYGTTAQARSLPDPRPANAAEINAYEQQLQQLHLAAENPPAKHPAQGSAIAPEALQPAGGGEVGGGEVGGGEAANAATPPDPLAQQQRKLMYESLFASNVALSYRARPQGGPMAPPRNTLDARIAAALGAGLTAPSPAAPAAAPKSVSPHAPPPAKPEPGLDVLPEGTIIPTVLLNRLAGDLPGPVECMVASDVYGPDRQHVLIPSGSRVLGEAKPVSAFGQQRLAVSFHRLILPDGASYALDNFTGLNPSGATGLHDQVNNHYWRIFGASIAIGLVGGAAEITAAPSAETGRGLYIEGVGSGMSQASMQVLDKFLNIMPTITIREGHRVAIFLTHDLLLPAYPAGRE